MARRPPAPIAAGTPGHGGPLAQAGAAASGR